MGNSYGGIIAVGIVGILLILIGSAFGLPPNISRGCILIGISMLLLGHRCGCRFSCSCLFPFWRKRRFNTRTPQSNATTANDKAIIAILK